MKRRTKKGNVTVEAAIVLPIFIMAVLSLAWYMDLSCARENIFHVMTDEAREAASRAYVTGLAPGLSGRIEERVSRESRLQDSYRVTSVSPRGGGVVAVNSKGVIVNGMPLKVIGDIRFDCNILYRNFVPRDNTGQVFSFDEMERDEEGRTVWVFPVAGERYHEEDCPYIKVNARQMLLTDSIRRRYEACSLCDPQGLPNGSLIYCFPRAGKVYHRASCTQVDRYVVSMSVTEAEKKGYTPCSKCEGGL